MAIRETVSWLALGACFATTTVACNDGGGNGNGNAGGSGNTSDASNTGGSNTADGSNGGGGSGNSGGSGGFVAATPPADVCSLLSLADVQTILPGAQAGAQQTTQDTPDVWNRICKWNGSALLVSVELVTYGALTEQGVVSLSVLAGGPGNGTKTPVSGVGDHATYWENSNLNTRGLVALQGNVSAGVTAYSVTPAPTQDQFTPLVKKALDQL
jgi:hypothetical protein